MKKNVFAIGLNDFNLEKLKRLKGAGNYAFHNLLDRHDIIDAAEYDVPTLLEKARKELNDFGGSIDAIIGYMDFPVSTLVPILASEFGTHATDLPSLLKCEHKYWSRFEQARFIPDNIPDFAPFDPFGEDPLQEVHLDYPFWIKPIKSFNSYLGFKITCEADFSKALEKIRKNIGKVGGGFEKVVRMVDLPPEIDRLKGTHCIAESLIGGHQCTLEGAIFQGKQYFHGIVDSIREPDSSVFTRYEYPSELPEEVQDRMKTLASDFLAGIGYNNAPFNIEFFWEEETDDVWLLEVNTRVAQHHSDLFEKVDGVSNHEVAVDVALGQEPVWDHGGGAHRKAAVFFLREFRDARVKTVPSPEKVREIEKKYPGTVIQLQIEEGMKLSDLEEQDSYSFNPAIIYVGGGSREQLLEKYEAVKEALGITLEYLEEIGNEK